MVNKEPLLHVKLVVCTSNSLTYFELNDDDSDKLHRHMVREFKTIFSKLVIELEQLGYDVQPEFYTDTLVDEDYHLRTSIELDFGNGREDVEHFHQQAQDILVSLADVASVD
jgi:hypothetical protein